ncbi:oxidoreductase [Diaminobutyricibacter sp. McL0608]|uniref:oxidoreductase n=1 Tax=Leifsonia sp. McL0608 TaxID=3143537 RepID=UPI0031F2F29D
MSTELNGKTALVTGASRGIGLAIVRALIAAGATVVGSSRRVSAELVESGAFTYSADLTTAEGPAELVRAALAHVGDLDIVVNCAGGGSADDLRGFFDYDDEIWRKTFDLNLFAAVRTCRSAIPSLVRRQGLVVNISSVGAHLPHTGPVPYGTAKAALTAYGKALAEEVAAQGVRVVTVTPGLTRTPTWTAADGLGATLAAQQGISQAELLAALPALSGSSSGRFVEPEEVAALVCFLASSAVPSMTGQEYLIDGGAIKTV